MADEQLRYRLSADDSQASRVLDGFGAKLQKLGQIAPIGGFGQLAGVFAAGGPFALGVVTIGALSAATVKLVGNLDDLDEAAQGLRTTAVELSELRIAAEQSGVGPDQLGKALGALNSRVDDAIAGNKDAVASFARFGVEVRDGAGKLKPTVELLGEVADRVRSLGDEENRGAALADIFGQKLGPRLVAYLNQGAEGLRVQSGLTQKMVDDAVKAQREIDKLGASWERFKLTIGGGIASAINVAIEFDAGAVQRNASEALRQAEQQLQIAKSQTGLDKTLGILFGAEPGELEIKAQETVDRLRAIRDSAGVDRFSGGQAAARAAESIRAALPGKDDAAQLERNQQALASYIATLQGLIDNGEELTNVQKALRALSQNTFGNLTEQSKQARDLLLQTAAAADRVADAQREQQRREGFAQFVQSIEQTVVAFQKLTNVERVELFLSQNPRSARTEQEKEAARAIAQRADEVERLNRLLEEQTRIDEQTLSIDSSDKRTQALRQQLVELSGITDEMRKIALSDALNEGLLSGELNFNPEQLDRIVKGIASIRDESEKTDDTLRSLGLTFVSAFENAAVNGDKLSDVFKGLQQDLARLAIRKNLTEPMLRFFDEIGKSRGNLSVLEAILQGLGGLFSSGGGASASDLNTLGVGLATNQSTGGGGLTATQSKRGALGAGTKGDVFISIDARGATDPAGIDRAARALREQVKADRAEERVRNPAFA